MRPADRGLSVIELQEFIERVRRAASSQGPEQAVTELLGELLEMPRPEWAQQGDGPAEQLLHHAQEVTIYLIRGEPMRRFPPHEHGMVAAVAMLEGTETHRFFATDPSGRRAAGTNRAHSTNVNRERSM